MDRRVFAKNLAGWTVIIAGMPVLVTACGNNSGTNGPAEEVWTSTAVENHTHEFTILLSDLGAPPASGLDGNTSATEGHTHLVMLTQDQVKTIASGGTVAVTTSTANGHAHDFSFSKATGTTTGTGGGGGTGGGTGY